MSKYGKVNPKFRKYFKHLEKTEGDDDILDKINKLTDKELQELKKRKKDGTK